ncbi:unnamed protein product, partial [Rotaria magnacalcarata]
MVSLEDKLESYIFEQISHIENAYISQLKELPFCSNEINDLWMICTSQLHEYSNRVRAFIDRIPNFNSINFIEKTSIIHLSTHSVILMCLCIQSL